MALKDWALPETKQLELVHPVKGATGIFLSILPEDSKQFKDIVADLMRRRAMADLSADPIAESIFEMELANELTAASVVGWSDDEAFDGPYSPERAREVLRMDGLAWMREQVLAFRSDRNNFFRSAG